MASKTVRIDLKDASLEVQLLWDRFDGDDCFDDCRFIVTPTGVKATVYEFGSCAVRAVRKMKAFLSDENQPAVSGGFRHPDIRTYDWSRLGPDLKLVVKFEGNDLNAEHLLHSPAISIEETPYFYPGEEPGAAP